MGRRGVWKSPRTTTLRLEQSDSSVFLAKSAARSLTYSAPTWLVVSKGGVV